MTFLASGQLARNLYSSGVARFVVALRGHDMRSYSVDVLMEWPLTGRNQEMRLVEAALCNPGVAGVVICGAMGSGKSRLAREALSAAASRGCVTHWVGGTSSARTLPLGAFSAWAESGVTDTVQLIRGVIGSLTAASPGTNPTLASARDSAASKSSQRCSVCSSLQIRRMASVPKRSFRKRESVTWDGIGC